MPLPGSNIYDTFPIGTRPGNNINVRADVGYGNRYNLKSLFIRDEYSHKRVSSYIRSKFSGKVAISIQCYPEDTAIRTPRDNGASN